nr:olfactory receptor class A-like protein 4 [Syngnathus scovelli]
MFLRKRPDVETEEEATTSKEKEKWIKIKAEYPEIATKALKILFPFPSGFSAVTATKTKLRSRYLMVVQAATETPSRRLPPSDTILVHLSLANLLTSLFRTVPIFVSDLGLDVSLSPGWCRVFMLLWVWWRAVGCWVTLALSIFHCATLKRQRVTFGPLALQRERQRVWIILGVVWVANLAFSTPALVYSTHVHSNATVELMVISCTTRPLLGCIWEFPSNQQGAAFASISLAFNEVLPLVLMVSTNLATLHSLAKHIRAVTAGGEHGELDKHVSGERKAAHVIMLMVTLFVVCWVLQVAAVTYYNHNRGHHAEGLLTVAHFSASLFVGFCPMVVALGHGKLRRRIVGMIPGCMKAFKRHRAQNEGGAKGTREKQIIFVVQKEKKSIHGRKC